MTTLTFLAFQAANAQILMFNGAASPTPAVSVPGFSPTYIASDTMGSSIYLQDSTDGTVRRVPSFDPTCSVLGDCVVVGSGLTGIGNSSGQGVAVDNSSNVYVIKGNGVWRIPSTDLGCTNLTDCVQIATGIVPSLTPQAIAVGPTGDVYIVNQGGQQDQLYHVPVANLTCAPGGAQCVNVGSFPSGAQVGLAVNTLGNIYIAVSYSFYLASTALYVVQSGVVEPLSEGPPLLGSIAADASGNVYFVAPGFTAGSIIVTRFTLNDSGCFGGSQPPCSVIYGNPTSAGLSGVAVDGRGNVYISNPTTSEVVKITPGVDFGSVAVGTANTGNPQSFTYAFQAADTVTAVSLLTLGTANKDYIAAAGTTCIAKSYAAGDTCTLQVNFTPTAPGIRAGAVQFADSNGVLQTTYLRGTGLGPLVAFPPGTQTIAIQ